MTVQPIRLFGDPVLRTPGRAGRRLRQGAAHARRGPHRDDARRARRRPGRAADRRRPAGVHLRRRRRARAPGQPEPRPRPTRSRTATRAACRSPGSPSTAKRALRRRRQGLQHARRAGRRSRAPSCWPAASSTRPTTSTASCSSTGSTASTRKAAMKAIREAEWSGEPGARRSRSARTPPSARRSRPCASSSPARPRSRCPSLRRAARLAGTRSSPSSPGPTRRPGAAASCAASPVAELRRRARASRCSSPRGRATRSSSTGCAELAPDCCPVVAYGALVPARRARHPARTAGSTCTSRCCPPGAARRPCSTRSWHGDEVTGASTFLLEEGLDTGPVFGVRHRADPARATPAATCSTGSPIAGAGLLVADPRRHRGRHAAGPCRSRPTASPRAEAHRRGRPRRLGRARARASTGWSAAAPRRPGAWTTFRGERLKLGPVRRRADGDRRSRPASCAVGKRATCSSAPATHAGRARRGAAARASSRWPPPTGPAASRPSRRRAARR